MSTADHLLRLIERAELRYSEGRYPRASIFADYIFNRLNKSGAAKKDFPSALLTRLAKIERKLGTELTDRDKDGSQLYMQAQAVLTKALDWYPYPDDVKLLNEQGMLFYDMDQYDKALEFFQKVIDRTIPPVDEKEKIYALQGAGASLRELRSFTKAEDLFEQAAAQDAELSNGILLERGWLRFYQKKYDSAFTDFATVLALIDAGREDKQDAMIGQIASRQAEDGRDAKGDKDRGKALMNGWLAATPAMISKEDAVKILMYIARSVHSYLNNYRAALLAYELVLEIDANNRKAYELKIEALKWLRRFEEAEQVYAIAQDKFPDETALWNEMGHTHYQQKRFQKAYDYFSGDALKERRFPDEQTETTFIEDLKADEYAAEWAIVTLRKMRRLPEAEKRVDEALATFGYTVNFLSEKAVIYFDKQEYEKAIEVFDRVLGIDEYNEFAHQWRAASFRKQRKFDEAEKRIADALRKLPAGTGLWEERAWIAFDQDDLNKAEEYFAEAIELDPYLIQRQFSRVEVLFRLNPTDNKGLQLLLELQKQFPDDIEVAEQLGWFYLRRGELEQAEAEFEFIQARDPENVPGINGMGGYYLEQRDYVSAEDAFRWALEKVDYEPQYHINLAWALIRQVKEPGELRKSELPRRKKLLDAATESCRSALELEPHNAKAHICFGVIAFKRNALLDAEGYFRKAIELSPKEGGYAELGALYAQTGRYDEAKTALTKAIEINKNDVRAYIEMVNLLVLLESYKEAVRQCRQAVSVDPRNEEAHRALAISLMRAGQYDEAEKSLRRAIDYVGESKQWQLHLTLSQLLIRLGDDNNKDRDRYDEALKHVYAAKRTNPAPHADIYFHEGIVQYRLEAYGSSKKNFDECFRTNRDRFEAERYSRLVKAMLIQQRILQIHTIGSIVLGAICVAMLALLLVFYYSGTKRTIPDSEQVASNNTAQNSNTAQNDNAAQTAKPESAKTTATPAKPREELIVDKSMLTFMIPLLLGLLVVALLLPNLNKLKLPGGFEAEISEKKESISSGPKGDIGFGSSLPIISPGPGKN
jgi:tetratricopeptide (TPR) repeat protein